MQVTTIAVTTQIFLVRKRVPAATSHAEIPEWYFRVTTAKGCQIVIALLLGVVIFLLHTSDLRAQPRPPQAQSGAQKEDSVVPLAIPSDVVIVPDGTPLTLKIEKGFSSATAKVGDAVEFTTPYPARINGLVIVPKGTAISGTVVQISAARRASRGGEVKIVIDNLNLSSGETATLRQVLKSESNGKKVGNAALMGPVLASASLVNPFVIPGLLFEKGNEKVYQAGTWTTVYFNGPLSLNRGALANLEPPPYKGPAQVFFTNRKGFGYNVILFSDQEYVGVLSNSVRLELKPGTYSFSTSKAKEQAVQLEVHEDQQYWVERERKGLFAKDSHQHRDEIEVLEDAPWVTDRNFSLETPTYKGPAQVNFVYRDQGSKLFCGQKLLFLPSGSDRIELNPGTYSFSMGNSKFSIGKATGQGVQIDVQEDHQYWIEIERGGLFIKDFQHLHDDIEHHRGPPIPDLDLTLASTRNSCLPAAK